MGQGGIALNALLRESEWKTSNHAVFVRVCNGRSFTREVRVARVAARVGRRESTARVVRNVLRDG
jgi:hypothetical protein